MSHSTECLICHADSIRKHWLVGLWWHIIIPKHLAISNGARLDKGWGGKDFVGVG